jgi:hypothetical protein
VGFALHVSVTYPSPGAATNPVGTLGTGCVGVGVGVGVGAGAVGVAHTGALGALSPPLFVAVTS